MAIPQVLVRVNQFAILALIGMGFVLQSPWPVVLLWLLLGAGLLWGPRWNLFFMIGRRLLARSLPGSPSESAELQQFNQSLAVALLSGSLLAFAAGATTLGWALALAVAAAAGLALCGFCLGCILYYQFKMLHYRMHSQRSMTRSVNQSGAPQNLLQTEHPPNRSAPPGRC